MEINLELENIDKLSDEEVAFWFGVLQQQEQLKQMRQTLKNYLDIKEAKLLKFEN